MTNKYVIEQLMFKERFSAFGNPTLSTPEDFDAAILKSFRIVDSQSKHFESIEAVLRAETSSQGLSAASADALAKLIETTTQVKTAIGALRAMPAGVVLLHDPTAGDNSLKFPPTFEAFLALNPNKTAADFAQDYGITSASYADVRAEYMTLNAQAGEWASKAKAARDALKNYADAMVTSEALEAVGTVVELLSGARALAAADDAISAVVVLAKETFSAITGIPTELTAQDIVPSILGPVLRETGEFLDPSSELIDEFQTQTGIRIVFGNTGTYAAGIVENLLLFTAQEKDTGGTFNLGTISTWGGITDVQMVGSSAVDSFTLVKRGLENVNVISAAGADVITIDTDSLTSILPINVNVQSGSEADEVNVAGQHLTVYAGTGDDTISLRSGDDVNAYGEQDNDTFKIAYDISGKIDGGSSFDVADYSDPRVELQFGTYESGIELQASDSSSVAVNTAVGNQTLVSIEKIVAGPNGDTVHIGSAIGSLPEIELGGNAHGLDRIDLREVSQGVELALSQQGIAIDDGSQLKITGFEVVVGTNYDDTISAAVENVAVTGGSGNDTLTGGATNDVLFGDDVDQHELLGGSATDVDSIGTGNDVLVGGAGLDKLFGGGGSDILFNGDLADLASGSNIADETVSGGAGTDYLILSGAQGGRIVIEKGDYNDVLLVPAEVLGAQGGSGGSVPLFALTGGVITEFAGNPDDVSLDEPWALRKYSSDYQYGLIFDGGGAHDGERCFAFAYENQNASEILSDIQDGGFENHASVPKVQYFIFESGALEIWIHGSSGDQFPWTTEPVFKINIEKFEVGDFGIELTSAVTPAFWTPPTEGAPASSGLTSEAAEWDSVISDLTERAEAYSLFAEAGISGILQRAAMLQTPAPLTAENVKVAIDGDSRDDRLIGLDVAEKISGHEGIDRLFGKGGNDRLDGGTGNDVLSGGKGADALDGGEGIDTADYRSSSAGVSVDLALGEGTGGEAQGDQLTTIEYVQGSRHNDVLTGNADTNRLLGNAGNDTLAGGDGIDFLVGGAGADALDGGAGERDVADYRAATAGVMADLAAGGSGGEAAGDTFAGIEYLYGSKLGDTLSGDAQVNRMLGEAGNDVLNGAGGNDYLLGGAGADALNGGDGTDVADYRGALEGVAADLASGGTGGEAAGDSYAGVEYLYGSDFADTIAGDAQANRLTGEDGNDVLHGLAGRDTLIGGAGEDTLTGGSEQDLFTFNAGAFGTDVITDFTAGAAAIDRVYLVQQGVASFAEVEAVLADTAAGAVLTLAGGSITFTGVSVAQFSANDFVFG